MNSKPNKASKAIAIATRAMISIAPLAFCVALIGCTPSEVSDTVAAIDAIGEVTIESQAAIEEANAKYEALSDERKGQVSNYATLEEANKRFNDVAYKLITELIENSDELSSSYFAQRYDTKAFQAARDTAQSALDSSDEASYGIVYAAFLKEVENLEAFVNAETEKSYSAQTSIGDHPFMVDESQLPEKWSFQPVVMQTSSHPEWITGGKEATDRPIYIDLFIDGSSRNYTFEITQLPTMEISIQDENGELQTALVNTQVQFTGDFDQAVNKDPNKELNERPGYFFADKSGRLTLALKNYDGEDYYVLYK